MRLEYSIQDRPSNRWTSVIHVQVVLPPLAVHGTVIIARTAALARRADARLGSAHAHNDRGCRQIEAAVATLLLWGKGYN